MILRSLLRDSAIYGGGDFFGKLVALVTFPVIAAALSTAAFGTLDLAITVAMLGGVFVRCGLNSAVMRFYWDVETLLTERPRIVLAIWNIMMGGTARPNRSHCWE